MRFELLYVSGLTGEISINGEIFSSTANAGDTLLVTADSNNRITITYIDIPAPVIFIIRYEGKYFYTTIYNLYCLYYSILI